MYIQNCAVEGGESRGQEGRGLVQLLSELLGMFGVFDMHHNRLSSDCALVLDLLYNR